MKNMEREKFERLWKKAFDEAEVTPSEKVWTNIELDLEKAKGGNLKRRLLFYQMLAAASIVFAMAIAGIGYYYGFRSIQTPGNNIALESASSGEPNADPNAMPNAETGASDAKDQLPTNRNNNPTDIRATDRSDKDQSPTALTDKSAKKVKKQPRVFRELCVSHLVLRRAMNGIVVCDVEHAKPFMCKLPKTILVDKLMHLFGRI